MKFTQAFVSAAVFLSAAHAAVVSSVSAVPTTVISSLSASPVTSFTFSVISASASPSSSPGGGYVVEGVYTTCVEYTFAVPTATPSSFFAKRAATTKAVSVTPSVVTSKARSVTPSVVTSAVQSVTPSVVSSGVQGVSSSSAVGTATDSAVVVFSTCLVFVPQPTTTAITVVGPTTSTSAITVVGTSASAAPSGI